MIRQGQQADNEKRTGKRPSGIIKEELSNHPRCIR